MRARRRGPSRWASAALALAAALLAARPARGQEPQIEATALDKVPQQTKFVEAEYPPEAAEKGIEAEVILLLDIDEQGKVTGAGIETPADPPGMGFDEAALVAAQMWEFEPAELDGKPIAVQISYRYRFTLKPKVPEQPATQPAATQPAATQPAATQPAATQPAATQPVAAPRINFAGRLVERGTRLPMPGVVVTVFRDDVEPPVGFEATTDAEGRFVFYDLATGTWKVLVDAPGYFPYRTAETIVEGERVDATFLVERGSYNPYDVTVTAPRPRKEVSRTVLQAEIIDKVPGGAGDPLAVVQNFAGVARSVNPGLLVVRGSAPEDTRIFVDGIGVPLIYHFGGLKSVLPIGVLSSIEFYPGNFSPQYGRATGGIIDVQIKELRPQKIGGYADISILDTGLYLELPLGDKGGIAVAGRRSYIDVILAAVVPDDAGVTLRTAPRYYDLQLLGSYRPAPRHDLRFFAFASDDRLKLLFENPAEIDPALEDDTFSGRTTFYRGIFQYRYVPGPGFDNALKLAIGRDEIDTRFGQQLRFELGITTLQLRDIARGRLAPWLGLNGGLDVSFSITDAFVRLPRPPKEGQPPTQFDVSETLTATRDGEPYWQPAAFLEADLEPLPGLTLLPGVRLDYFDLTDQAVVQPRFTARWQATPMLTPKAGVGLFAQEPQFEEVDEQFGNPALGVERALHASVGLEVRPLSWLTLDATGFYKRLWDLVSPTSALVTGADGSVRPLVYDNGGTGDVWGLELQVRHELAHNLTGWITYTLSRAQRRDSDAMSDRLFDFDQTHILNVVANYLLPRNWQVGGRFRYVTGNPITPVVGAVFNAGTDRYDPVYGAVNTSRTGAFAQFDLRVDKRWIYERWILAAYLDIQNVTNRANPEGREYNFDFSESRALTGIPILTIIGVRGEF